MSKLYALLIAINEYPNPRHQLKGCVNDLQAIDQFLNQYCSLNGIQYLDYQLTNQLATRNGIIAGFKHFENAQKDDLCLLYYSGHGSQMSAPPEFWRNETDRKCESIVCYDSRLPNGRDLADKEISYLLHRHTNGHDAHVLTVFDCCHAGSISRNRKIVNRMADPNLTEVQAKDFVGVKENAYEKDGDQLIPPERKHIALSASRAYESAVELDLEGHRRGLFTSTLIEVLNDSKLDQISYVELMNRIQTRVSNVNNKQHPIISAWGQANTKAVFLKGQLKLNPQLIIKQGQDGNWIMDWGAIHGVQIGDSISVLAENETSFTAQVKEVFPAFAKLETEDWMKPDQGFYPIQAVQLQRPKMKVSFHPDAEEEIKAAILNCEIEHITLTEDSSSNYWIHSEDQRFKLLAPGEDRPLFKSMPWSQDNLNEVSQRFVNNIQKVALWKNLSNLTNPLSQIDINQELECQLSEAKGHYNFQKLGNGRKESKPLDGSASFDYHFDGEEWTPPALMFSIKNIGSQNLWVTALVFTEDYGISNIFLPVKELSPGSESYEFTDVFNDFRYNLIPLVVSDALHSWGISTIQNQIKIIASNQPFSVDDLCQEGLEMEAKRGETKGFGSSALRKSIRKRSPDWTTKDIIININRPQEGKALIENQGVELQGLTIEPHSAFRAELVRLTSSNQINRGDGEPPSPDAFFSSENFEPLNLATERDVNTLLDVIELKGIEHPEMVHEENPLRLKVHQKIEADTSFIPFGYDKELGIFMPLGYTNPNGEIWIESLPQIIEQGKKGLKHALKLYLQKVKYKCNLKADYPYPILASAKVDRFENLEYLTDPEVVRKEVQNANRILILVHGLLGDTSDKAKVIRRYQVMRNGQEVDLSAIYDILLTFDYESLNTPVEQTAMMLKERLENIAGLKPGHGKTVHIIAHSLGGLVSRWFLEKEGGDQIVNHFIQVGSPNIGSPWTNTYRLFTFALGRVINFTPIPSVINSILSFVGRKTLNGIEVTTNQISPGSDFLAALNNEEKGARIPYTLILGDSKKLPNYDPRVKKYKKKFLKRFIENAKNYLVKKLFEEENDDIVAISSMTSIPSYKASNIDYYESVGCHHFNYFTNTPGLKMITKVLFEIEAKETTQGLEG